jgi:NTP pyrophosphatase (non-canonical NTP hydrolase)
MKPLKELATLNDYQNYVREMEVERGFSHHDVLAKCLLLGEEVGELFKSVRKATKMSIDPNSATSTPAQEMADILIMLCSIANRLDVNLESAFREKENINNNRIWTVEK